MPEIEEATMKKFILGLMLFFAGFVYGQEYSPGDMLPSEDGVRLELLSVEDVVLVKYTQLDIEGNVIQEGRYLNGKPHGTWKMYHVDGEVTTMKFKNGKRIALNTIIDGRKTKVIYEDNKPLVVTTEF
jgi:hypothetical protein